MFDPSPAGLQWKQASRAPQPAPDALHLWRIDLHRGDAADDARGLATLSSHQRARHDRLRSPVHRRRYLRTQAGCRAVLAGYLGVEPAAVAFRYGPAGKPELAGDAGAGLRFNLTGTDDLALLAVGVDLPLGVDCEGVHPRSDLHGIAKRMFAPEVATRLAELPSAHQLFQFYLHWTALEARVKADGRGLAGYRDADLPGLAVAHAMVDVVGTPAYVCAVARQQLPAPARWQALGLAVD
jgi:4'-phosphopantetheinyl transferase